LRTLKSRWLSFCKNGRELSETQNTEDSRLIFTLALLARGQFPSSSGQYYPNRQYDTNGQYRPAQSSNNEPGYLPDYQGDMYTNQQRIAETQALNRPFFDSIGGPPPPPPKTPAQLGLFQAANSQISSYSLSGNMYTSSNNNAYPIDQNPSNQYGFNPNYPTSLANGEDWHHNNYALYPNHMKHQMEVCC
uniref:Trithorax group protein osa n=1 Tax=Angiostrongylus costaricensis TaxID=334426 RepID=A0A0R3PLP7_ANGCS